MDFKTILKEQRDELERIEKEERIIPREFLGQGKNFLKYPNILAVLGIRRCGKSIFSYLLAKESKFGYINFDDERLLGTKAKELNSILQSFYEMYGDLECIVLDEIQNTAGWELFVNRLRRTKKIIITGSNSHLLSGELSTHLTGRHLDITLFPFSFREFLDLKGVHKSRGVYTTLDKAELSNLLLEYLETGGFPEADKFGRAMVPRIYDDIITKDILLRYKIKKKEEIRKLARYLITNFAQEFTYRKLREFLSVKNLATLSNWVSYLEASFLVLKLERFSFRLKEQFLAPKKIYCIDPGIVRAIGFTSSDLTGRLMENVVAIELQRKKSADPHMEVYYWKDYQQHEVDFLIKRGRHISALIQVTYASRPEDVRERETEGLVKASHELKCSNLLVITWNYEDEKKASGRLIRYIPLWKWLME